MAQIIFKRGQSANLAGLGIADGQLIFTVDNGRIYLDNGTTRVQMFKDVIDDAAMLKAEVAKLLGGKVDPDTGEIVADETVASVADQIATAVATEKARAEAAEKVLEDKIGTASVPETAEGAGDGKAASGLYAPIEKNAADIKALQEALGTGSEGDGDSLSDRVAANETAIETLTGEGAGSVKKTVDDAINEFATKVTDDGVVNSYKELIDYVAEHGSEATEMAGDISDLKTIVGKAAEGEDAATGLVKTTADNAAAIAAEITRAKAAEEANADAIEVLNGDDTVEGSVAKAIKDALTGDDEEGGLLSWNEF